MEREEFHRRVVAAWKVIGLDEIAKRAMTSRPVAQRWLEGTACPHPVARESAIQAIERT